MPPVAFACSLAGVLLLALTACGPEEARPFDGEICVAARHHGAPVAGLTFYRIDAAAAGDVYPDLGGDLAARYPDAAESGLRDRVCFADLNAGRHFLAAAGWEEAIRDSVFGTLTLDLDVLQRRVDTVLQVSEVH